MTGSPVERNGSMPLVQPLHHLGFVVPDLRRAIDHWVGLFGAGPFYVLDAIAFDRCTSEGADVVFDHSSAFGQWGQVPVELMQVHRVEPGPLSRLLAPTTPMPHHVAIAVADADAERARLAGLGMPAYLDARIGGIEISFHDASASLGCSIEVHQAGEALDAHFAVVAEGARNWDGASPQRSF